MLPEIRYPSLNDDCKDPSAYSPPTSPLAASAPQSSVTWSLQAAGGGTWWYIPFQPRHISAPPPQAFPHPPQQALPHPPQQAFPHPPPQAFPHPLPQAFPQLPPQAFPQLPPQAFPQSPLQAFPQPSPQAFPQPPPQASPQPLPQQQPPPSPSPPPPASSRDPKPPVTGSKWVMWVGNVPGNAKHDEVWRFFTQQGGAEDEKNHNGVLSVFPISRSRCAFVNYDTEDALYAAIQRFDGVPMRTANPRAARLVCRVRGNDEELHAGVGLQRGTRMHVEWVRKHAQSNTYQLSRDFSASSNASTTSNFFETHFPQRFFILKSLTQAAIETSISRGLWATQQHNEIVLDQAFRTAEDVFLFFSVNRSGGFCGVARMQSSIGDDGNTEHVEWGAHSVTSPAPEDPEPQVLVASPDSMHPNETLSSATSGDAVEPVPHACSAQTAPPLLGPQYRGISFMAPSFKFSLGQRRPMEYGPEEEGDEAPRYALSPLQHSPEGDLAEEPLDEAEKDGEGWGRTFRLRWLSTVHVPFRHTQHIRNPWNQNRGVKVSRDGTELEPEAGWTLLAEWKGLSLNFEGE